MNHEELRVALGGDGMALQAANSLMREYNSWPPSPGVTAEFVSTLRRDELLDIRNFGPVSLARVEEWLAREGMSLLPSPWQAGGRTDAHKEH